MKSLGRVRIFLSKKWVEKVIDVTRVSDRMIAIKVLVQGMILLISVYAPQCSLDDSQKEDSFYDNLMNVRELGEKDTAVISGGCNGLVRSKAEDYDNQHGGYGYGVMNKERERILKFCKAMNMTVGNTLFKEGKSISTL